MIERYIKDSGIEMKMGNLKLSLRTMVMNMGSALVCPSDELDQCLVSDFCYAKMSELTWPSVEPRRCRQKDQWMNIPAADYVWACLRARDKFGMDLLRYNESGDFWSQRCVEKLDWIAYTLRKEGIRTYGYTARYDLDFNGVAFITRVSHPTIIKEGTYGNTCVFTDEPPKGWFVCKGDCRKCITCSLDKRINIAFKYHCPSAFKKGIKAALERRNK